jgi:hypothetical protein
VIEYEKIAVLPVLLSVIFEPEKLRANPDPAVNNSVLVVVVGDIHSAVA